MNGEHKPNLKPRFGYNIKTQFYAQTTPRRSLPLIRTLAFVLTLIPSLTFTLILPLILTLTLHWTHSEQWHVTSQLLLPTLSFVATVLQSERVCWEDSAARGQVVCWEDFGLGLGGIMVEL